MWWDVRNAPSKCDSWKLEREVTPMARSDLDSSAFSHLISCEGEIRGSGGGQEGIYRSSLDAREPQNPTRRVPEAS
eukprot:480524-Prorocentrum_minimum.AAC.1